MKLFRHSPGVLIVLALLCAAPAAGGVIGIDPFSGGEVAAVEAQLRPLYKVPVAEMTAPPAAVPGVRCAAGSHPDPNFQGDPGSNGGYDCNLSLVGQFIGDGATGFGLAWYGHCAYVATMFSTYDTQYNQLKGVEVIDAANPAHPVLTERLQTPSMVQPHESLKASATAGLLAADQGGPLPLPYLPREPAPISPGDKLDVWNVKHDCAHPTLDASVDIPQSSGHEGNWSPDGRTYWISTIENPPHPAIIAVDLSVPTHPRAVDYWQSPVKSNFGFHGLQIQPGGDTGFFAAQDGPANGLVIANTSGVQHRRPDPTPTVTGAVSWHDSDVTQSLNGAVIGGHHYAIASDETGATRNTAQDCAQRTAPFGFVHIVNVDNPAHPVVASTIALQSNSPSHCATMSALGAAVSELAFSSHYCAVDRAVHTTALACTWLGSGLRVFDIRNPLHPREIAYYVPPGRPTVIRGDIMHNQVITNPNLDATGTPIRWLHTAAGEDLWFASMENGFQIVKLNPNVYPLPALAGRPATRHRRRRDVSRRRKDPPR